LRNRGYNRRYLTRVQSVGRMPKTFQTTRRLQRHRAGTTVSIILTSLYDCITTNHYSSTDSVAPISFRLIIIIPPFPNLYWLHSTINSQNWKLRNASQRTDRSRPLCDSRPIIVEITEDRTTYVSVVRQSFNSDHRRPALDH